MKVLYRVNLVSVRKGRHMSNLPDNKKDNLEDLKDEWNMADDVKDFEDFEFDEPYDARRDVKPERKSNVKSFLYDLLFYAILIFVTIYIIPNYVIQRTIVDGSSMENSLHNGEHLIVEKISYRFNQLDRFDIIVFYPYGRKNKDDYYVKRIIGLPGETVQIIGEDIYINNILLEEDYGKNPIEDPGRAAQPIKLGSDEYFVLGDNRNISRDSRDSDVGNVLKENIGGRAVFRISPLSRFGTID